jgi:predicted enzyme related to lactoylglutathione lyase
MSTASSRPARAVISSGRCLRLALQGEPTMGRPVHFEIHADDPERAQRFYTEVFGWRFQRWGDQPYWVIQTGQPGESGIDGGLLPRHGARPVEGAAVNAFPCTIDVADLDACAQRVEREGGRLVVAKNAVPGVGWLAYAKDTEGNIFGVMQTDADAR